MGNSWLSTCWGKRNNAGSRAGGFWCCGRSVAFVDVEEMERERQEGQALLRQMVLSSDDVDWQQVISKANELHAREQESLRKQSERQRRAFQQRQRRALRKRRKYDSIGSFSVNMLTYRMEPIDDDIVDTNDDDNNDNHDGDFGGILMVDTSKDRRDKLNYSHKSLRSMASTTLEDASSDNLSSIPEIGGRRSSEEELEKIDEEDWATF